jgi:TRAP-type C4-dicarboxylate transport system permease small subunit
MKYYFSGIRHLSRGMRVLSGAVLSFMMLLTVFDVVMRYIGKPIMGAYDLVGMAGAALIALVLPITTLNDGHVRVDFLTEQMSFPLRKRVTLVTKILGVLLFLLLGYGLMAKGVEMYTAREASLTLHVPLSPICFVVGLCCFTEVVALVGVLVEQMRKRGNDE